MVPFFDLSFYAGSVTQILGGADISFLVGLVVAGVLYYGVARGIDIKAEQQAIRESNELLAKQEPKVSPAR